MQMAGWSMAPWLKPGDILMVDRRIGVSEIREGEIIVMEDASRDMRYVHRVISVAPALLTKGDRNREVDSYEGDWKFAGKVVGRVRGGHFRVVRRSSLLRILSVWGLYPGQRLPAWLTRTKILRGVLLRLPSRFYGGKN